ncbi:ABC transporter ATP-binding protein, partial [Candidatus Bipolaricaulota bacterium]|nr:ABC transporter ATP-binding protein [Candidatus Bipolaricaulota bacterium]
MKSLRSMLRHVKRYKIPLALTMGSMLVLVGIQLLGPWLVRAMISAVTDPEAGPETMALLARLALLALGVYFIRAVMRFVRSYSAHVAGWHVVADVRNEVYRHLQRLSLRFYEDKQTGQLMSRTVNDSTLLEQ